MGFKVKSERVRFDAYGDTYEGLDVYVKPTSIGALKDIMTAADAIPDDIDPMKIDEIMNPIIGMIVRNVRSWNLEGEDDEPLPIAIESVTDQGLVFTQHFIEAYIETMVGVPDPLVKPSTGGASSVEAPTLPMEAI